MRFVQIRRALFVGMMMTALSITLVIEGCSSDKPAPADTTSTSGSSGTSGGVVDGSASDTGLDSAFDASIDQNGPPNFVCLDDKPLPTDGGVDGGSPSACPSSPTCSQHCDNIFDHYKLGVAQFAIACILALPSCAQKTLVTNCVDKALGRACVDPTAPGYCSPLVTACDPNAGGCGSSISQTGCESFANGLSATGRTTLSSCMQTKIAAGTCATEIGTCVDEIRL